METRVSPLPVGQVIALAGVNFVNAVVYLVTLPVAPFIVISFCPDLAANDVGFRSGALEGCFHAGAFFGAAFWAWVADRHGRKSALLWSLAGTAILSVAFGLASSYGAALVIKLLWGFISGVSRWVAVFTAATRGRSAHALEAETPRLLANFPLTTHLSSIVCRISALQRLLYPKSATTPRALEPSRTSASQLAWVAWSGLPLAAF